MKATVILIERRVLEAVLTLHAVDMPLTGDIVEPIRRAIAAADTAVIASEAKQSSLRGGRS